MKKTLIILGLPLVAGLFIFLSSYSGSGEHDYPSGSPAGYTGSPGDGKDCTQCHGGTSTPVTGWITSDIPGSGYTAGSTYNITVSVSGSGHKGFEVSPQNAAGDQLGTLIEGVGSHLTGGTKYVTHNSDPTSNPATWTFQWTAPAAGTGQVTFYGAFANGKNDTRTSTLVAEEAVVVPLTVTASATPSTIPEGDSSHLDANPSGGSGNYTYSWTSNPAGFTSTLKDPWVTPAVTTTYTVTVSDGTSTAMDDVTVTVTSTVGIAGNGNRTDFRLSPNPTRGRFIVSVAGYSAGNLTCRIYTLAGKMIWEKAWQATTTDEAIAIDLGAHPDGVYLVAIQDQTTTKTRKIVKSNE